MAILEWKKFDFFNLVHNVDKGKVAETIAEADITSCISHSSQKIVCDANGMVHIFYRGWDSLSFQAHNAPIILCSLSTRNNFLVTISRRDIADPPLLKVWDLSKVTKRNGATNLGSARTIIQTPTAIAATHGSGNHLIIAIGYERGEISLFRGPVTRDFSGNFKNLTVGTRPISGISFKDQGKQRHMFVCSDHGVYLFILHDNDRETKVVLDSTHAPARCHALQTKGPNEDYFMIGRDDAVYCYTSDGRGPCYALEGQKHFIEWFPNYLVIVMKSTKNVVHSQKEFILIVIDIQNKFIVFQAPVDPVIAILNASGTCLILTTEKQIYHLVEKDIHSKLNMLFKKNLYDIALRITKEEKFEHADLAEIYKQYGDHLYLKGDYSGSVEKYIKSIGFVEPSYIIMKFIDSRHIKFLVKYLQALHEEKKATPQHTTLLMNCYTRLDLPNKLDELFINNEDMNEFMFDINMVIRSHHSTTLQGDRKNEYNLSMMFKQIQDPKAMLKSLSKLTKSDILYFFQKYGLVLMSHAAENTTELLSHLCSNQVISNSIEDLEDPKTTESIAPEQFIPMFGGKDDLLYKFLDKLIRNPMEEYSPTLYNTYLELQLKRWAKGDCTENEVLDSIKTYRQKYNKEQALILCLMAKFWAGILYLYEEDQLYNLTIRYYVQNKDYSSLLNCCKNLGQFQPYLWIQSLNELHNDPETPANVLMHILNVITSEKLQSPLQILQCLAVENGPKISHVKDYYTQVFHKETAAVTQEEKDVQNLESNLKSLQELLKNFAANPIEFRNTICDACTQPLCLPAVYFLCQHAFHQDCVRTYSETEKDCSICSTKNFQLTEMLRTQQESQDEHETFHRLLNHSNDMLHVLSGYFGRGMLNQIFIVDEQKGLNKNTSSDNSLEYDWSSKMTKSEGPIQIENPNTYNWSGRMPRNESEMLKQQATFTKIKYDESKNPFNETSTTTSTSQVMKTSTDTKNPFETYDSNLNPFEDDDDNVKA